MVWERRSKSPSHTSPYKVAVEFGKDVGDTSPGATGSSGCVPLTDPNLCSQIHVSYLSFFLTRLMKFEGTIFHSMSDQQSSD